MMECIGRTFVPWWETNIDLGEAVDEEVVGEGVRAMDRETVVMGDE
jgi:sortase (surface protein transpeptidase)